MRYLLARTKYSDNSLEMKDIKEEHDSIKRLFGASKPIVLSRLQFQDILLSDETEKNLKI